MLQSTEWLQCCVANSVFRVSCVTPYGSFGNSVRLLLITLPPPVHSGVHLDRTGHKHSTSLFVVSLHDASGMLGGSSPWKVSEERDWASFFSSTFNAKNKSRSAVSSWKALVPQQALRSPLRWQNIIALGCHRLLFLFLVVNLLTITVWWKLWFGNYCVLLFYKFIFILSSTGS